MKSIVFFEKKLSSWYRKVLLRFKASGEFLYMRPSMAPVVGWINCLVKWSSFIRLVKFPWKKRKLRFSVYICDCLFRIDRNANNFFVKVRVEHVLQLFLLEYFLFFRKFHMYCFISSQNPAPPKKKQQQKTLQYLLNVNFCLIKRPTCNNIDFQWSKVEFYWFIKISNRLFLLKSLH